MNEKDLERREVLGVLGAGLIAALVAALAAMSPLVHGRTQATAAPAAAKSALPNPSAAQPALR